MMGGVGYHGHAAIPLNPEVGCCGAYVGHGQRQPLSAAESGR